MKIKLIFFELFLLSIVPVLARLGNSSGGKMRGGKSRHLEENIIQFSEEEENLTESINDKSTDSVSGDNDIDQFTESNDAKSTGPVSADDEIKNKIDVPTLDFDTYPPKSVYGYTYGDRDSVADTKKFIADLIADGYTKYITWSNDDDFNKSADVATTLQGLLTTIDEKINSLAKKRWINLAVVKFKNSKDMEEAKAKYPDIATRKFNVGDLTSDTSPFEPKAIHGPPVYISQGVNESGAKAWGHSDELTTIYLFLFRNI